MPDTPPAPKLTQLAYCRNPARIGFYARSLGTIFQPSMMNQ